MKTEILSDSISKVLSSDKTTVKESETVHKQFRDKTCVNFISNPTPDGATYVEGTVKLNGVSQPTFSPIKGFTIPDIDPDETVIIEYELKADNNITATTVTHFATLDYSVYDPARGEVNYS
ncbi:MAG: hypothetical protein HFE40_05975 [Clostridia bacterium]|nr:hypothetical protein [Clostridia bacterium]